MPDTLFTGRVLIVEGGDLRARIVEHFKSHGWDVRESATLHDAIAAAQLGQPHVVVTALALPDVSGFGFARALRVVVDHDVLVIAFSGDPESPIDEARGAGFDAVFGAPIDLDQIQLAASAGDEHRRTVKMPRLLS